jgi:UDP-glucose 4-epimerase
MSRAEADRGALDIKALVTGANGFVGRALLRAAPPAGIEAAGLARRAAASFQNQTLTDYSPPALAALIARLQPDVLVHAAGSASVAASLEDTAGDFYSSVGLYQKVLEAVRLSAARPRVVYLSSAAVYGNPQHLPVPESAERAPVSPYGRHKAVCELLGETYGSCFGIPTLTVRAFSLFGVEQHRLLIWELYRQFQERAEVMLAGTGDEERDYLHVDDFAASLWQCARAARAASDVVNVASGRSIRVRDLAERVRLLLRADKPVRFRGQPVPGNPLAWRADVTRLHSLVGDRHHPDLAERLQQVIAAWAQ